MKRKNLPSPTATELATQPFFYEIRVRGRLSGEPWADWFDDLTVSAAGGETTLRGVLPDHAALYALLGRLRDLGVPLLAVSVLDAEARRRLDRSSRRHALAVNLMLLAVYLMLLGGLVALTTLLTSSRALDTGLALALLFAAIGGLSYAFDLWSGVRLWRWITCGMWPASILTFLIFTSYTRLLPPALAIALILFLSAGGLLYGVVSLRRRGERLNRAIAGWRALGDFGPPAAGDDARRDEPRR